jgi:hypothetical protein
VSAAGAVTSLFPSAPVYAYPCAYAARGRRLATASSEVVAARSAIIGQLPALGALVPNTPAGTEARLRAVLDAVQFPDQVSTPAAVSAASYVALLHSIRGVRCGAHGSCGFLPEKVVLQGCD